MWPTLSSGRIHPWICAKCELHDSYHETAGDLWDSWRAFATRLGAEAGTPAQFAAEMERRGFTIDRLPGEARRIRWGIRLRAPVPQADPSFRLGSVAEASERRVAAEFSGSGMVGMEASKLGFTHVRGRARTHVRAQLHTYFHSFHSFRIRWNNIKIQTVAQRIGAEGWQAAPSDLGRIARGEGGQKSVTRLAPAPPSAPFTDFISAMVNSRAGGSAQSLVRHLPAESGGYDAVAPRSWPGTASGQFAATAEAEIASGALRACPPNNFTRTRGVRL